MPTFVDEHAHLRAADDHLRMAVHLFSTQEDRLVRCRALHLDTRLHEESLVTMHLILRELIAHRSALRDAVEHECRSPR
ncbi:hypothetical protein DF105_34925 [Burkholderia stagnalis]|nr:hypothetical protein DF163_34915 [Burkholderia stagnalis]RQQ21672.1 hypothetical protein DF149_34395 [Burkholderia stagnalis]RQQ40087.1 hypothetical protein DF162_34665 [Burkholderia stagnalis]RQY09356.1 hypothetical protein DF117_35415 [Burkholderia stagnalis]RQY40857.1 hypothetical protein DF112_35505 [Burkholderia stagnalis]